MYFMIYMFYTSHKVAIVCFHVNKSQVVYLFDFCHGTISLSPFFFVLLPDACVHVIGSEPGAVSRPGVQQPNKLSAKYQVRPAGKRLCVRLCVRTSVCL